MDSVSKYNESLEGGTVTYKEYGSFTLLLECIIEEVLNLYLVRTLGVDVLHSPGSFLGGQLASLEVSRDCRSDRVEEFVHPAEPGA